MRVIKYENACQQESGIRKHNVAEANQRQWFSLANFKNLGIYVIGGYVNGMVSDSVVVLNL